MTKKQTLPVKFSKKFLWGAATSAHQVEGNTHNQWTVWELENAKILANQAEHSLGKLAVWSQIKDIATDPDNYVSGRATDHYNRYEEDFDILTQLNLNTFRFSIEWSRVEPEEGVWDIKEIEHYRQYLIALKRRNIEPMMTLMHWTMPTWFADKGGFEKRSNVKYFTRFVDKVLEELGRDVRYICTLNEPEVYVYNSYITGAWPPGKTNRLLAFGVYLNLAYAHNQVARITHKRSRRFLVGISKDCSWHYAGDDSFLSRLTAGFMTWAVDYFFLDRIRRNLDWLGLNYYFSNRYVGFERQNPNDKLNDMGWDMQPQHLQFVIERLYNRYKMPIIVTESGVADRNDAHRKWWITYSLIAIYNAMQHGVDVRGYIHWSLLDNFEWAYGKWPNFGLVHVDYKTLKRTVKKSALWYAGVLKQLRGL